MSQMIFKEKKQSTQNRVGSHQDNSYPMNENGQYITINIFLEKSNLKMELCMF